MYLKSLLLLFVSNFLYASTIDVHYKLKSFHIAYDQTQITYKDTLSSLTIKDRPCIHDSFLALKNNLANYMEKEFLGSADKYIMTIKYNGVKHYEREKTYRSEYLLNFLEELKKIKIEEDIGCNK